MKSIDEAVKWARGMNGKPAPGGPGHCQELAREAYGLPAWATSAKLAFEKTPTDQKHHGKPSQAPRGAFVYYPTLSDYGHVVISLGDGSCVTNDYARRGFVTIAPLELPSWHGEANFGGWSFWTPYGVAH